MPAHGTTGQNLTAEDLDAKLHRYRYLVEPEADAASALALRPADWPLLDKETALDRAVGCLLGIVIGDAVGAAVEFKPRGSFPPVTDMVGGGPFNLAPGEWTGNTTMALCLAGTLIGNEYFDQYDFMVRLQGWLERGDNTVPGKCFDIGNTTKTAIESFIDDDNPAAGPVDALSADNGSLVRLAPLAIFSANDGVAASFLAVKQSRATHGTIECLDACELFASQLVDALNGADKDSATRPRVMASTPRTLFINAGEWRGKTRDEIRSSNHVIDTLEAALWSVWQTDNFRDAVLKAANLGDDASSVAAAAGQLAGALYGAASIPEEWLTKLAWRNRIEELANELYNARPAKEI